MSIRLLRFYPLAIVHARAHTHLYKYSFWQSANHLNGWKSNRELFENLLFSHFFTHISCIHVILMLLSKAHQFVKEQYKYYWSSIFKISGGKEKINEPATKGRATREENSHKLNANCCLLSGLNFSYLLQINYTIVQATCEQYGIRFGQRQTIKHSAK